MNLEEIIKKGIDNLYDSERNINYDSFVDGVNYTKQAIWYIVKDKNKEIERQSKMLINRDKELLKLNDELEKLRKITKQDECDYYVEGLEGLVKEKDREIERLNKIINTFESYLFGQMQIYGGGGLVQEYYDKLKELKEKK